MWVNNIFVIVPKNLKLGTKQNHNFIFQVDPPFQYSATVQNIALADSPVPAGTNVGVTGWGYNWVIQYIQY
jgi:hypothetical protein